MSMWSEKRRFGMQSLFSSLGLMPNPLSFQVYMSFLHSRPENRVEEETAQGVGLFCPTSDAEFITFHVSQYGGALINVQFSLSTSIVH